MNRHSMVLALVASLLPARASAQTVGSPIGDAAETRQQVERLALAWAARYGVPEAEYRAASDDVPERLPWSTCIVTQSPLHFSCSEDDRATTEVRCRAVAIALLATRAVALGFGIGYRIEISDDTTCREHHVLMSLGQDGEPRMQEIEPRTGRLVDVAAAGADAGAQSDSTRTGEDPTHADKPAADSASKAKHTGHPPVLRNRWQISQELERLYPPGLRQAGLGGSATVWLFVDERGRVLRVLLQRSGGWRSLDSAAVAVGQRMRFRPATLDGQPVPVWVAVPIVFAVRGGGDS